MIFDSKLAKIRCTHKNYQHNFFLPREPSSCLNMPFGLLSRSSAMSGGRALVGAEERQNSVVFLCVCISALVLLYSAGEPFVFSRLGNSMQYTECWLVFRTVRWQTGWLTVWVTDDWVGGSFSVDQVWHRTDVGRWSDKAVIKRQQVSRRSVSRLCWSAVSGCFR